MRGPVLLPWGELFQGGFDGGVEAEHDGVSTEAAGFMQGTPDEGGAATGGDADDDVFLTDAAVSDGGGTGLDVVFSAFDGAPEGLAATGDDALDLFARGAEGGGDLTGVEDAEPTAGASADVEQASARCEGFGDPDGDGGDGAPFFGDGGWEKGVLREHEGDGLLRRHPVKF